MQCKKCGHQLTAEELEKAYWDESGYGYSTKLVKCPECGQICVVGYVEDYGFDVNNDKRFYEYRRK